MALAKKCDRCGKLYEHYPISIIGFCYNAIRYCLIDSNGNLSKEYRHKDLCPDCLDKLTKFMTVEEKDYE